MVVFVSVMEAPVVVFVSVTLLEILLTEGLLTLPGFLLAISGVLIVVGGWWISHAGPLASKVALPAFLTGGLLGLLLPLLPLPGPFYFATSVALVLMFSGGFAYLAVHDWERIEAGKQSVYRQESWLMAVGFILLVGYAFTFLVGSTSSPPFLGVRLPIPSVAWDAFRVAGVIPFGLAATLARRKKVEHL